MAHDLQSHQKAQPESLCPERACLRGSVHGAGGRRDCLFQIVGIVPSNGGQHMNCERAIGAGLCRYSVYRRGSVVFALVLIATALFFSVSAFAQGTTGTLRGQVLDPAGAAVANAQVTATNKETGVSTKIVTTSAGTYSFPSILPGKYSVIVEVSG